MRVGVAQVSGPPGSAPDNRSRTMRAARELFEDGARLVVLPELAVPGYGWDPSVMVAGAEPLHGDTVTAWMALAREHAGYIAGGFAERARDRVYNAAVLVGPEGILLHYRKLHLFAGEKQVFTPGDRGLPVARTPDGTIGLCICYDLRFVETLRVLALRGAELVCVPTAWVEGFDRVRWDDDGFAPQARGALLQANLDQVYVACASQAGKPDAHRFLGSSLIADPYGRCVSGPLPGDRDGFAIADLDMAQVRAARDRGKGVSPSGDRRDDVYGLIIDGDRL